MKIPNWHHIEDEISKLIVKHTSKIKTNATADYANTIIDAWQFGKSFEKIVSGDKPPEKDQEILKKAATKLLQARELLLQVGHHGSVALEKQSQINANNKLNQEYRLSENNYSEILGNSLSPISYQLEEAAKMLNASDRGLIAVLSGAETNPPPKKGRKQKTTAHYIAKTCAGIFMAGTDHKISITHDPYDNVAGGKFHTFLTEVFKLLEIKANAEHCIKALLKEENADLK